MADGRHKIPIELSDEDEDEVVEVPRPPPTSGEPPSTSGEPPSTSLSCTLPAQQAGGAHVGECVRILHLSDTHGMHRSIENNFPLPPADILVHTGDFTDNGRKSEFADFDKWLATLRSRYPHIVVCIGNHEYNGFLYDKGCAATREAQSAGKDWFRPSGKLQKSLLPHATHVLEHETAEIRGLRFYGSSWCAWHYADAPGDAAKGPEGAHRFDEIPPHVDVLLTHGAPRGILDRMEDTSCHWGSSKSLRAAIERTKPKVHLFGHIHEQRGVWHRMPGAGAYSGGVEYMPRPGTKWRTFPPPKASYPCELISCNAMANHPDLEGVDEHKIAGPARLIVATRSAPDRPWTFAVGCDGAAAPPAAPGGVKRAASSSSATSSCSSNKARAV